MQHVTEALTTSPPYTGKTDEQPDSSSRAIRVWVELAEVFGKAHYRENGAKPTTLWVRAIARLSDQQIISGLVNLGNDDLKFPANLSMFLSACKRSRPVRQLGVKLLPLSDAERQANADKAWADMERLAGRSLPRDV